MVRQSSQDFDVLVRDVEGHRRRSVLGGVKGPVRRSGVSRSGATLTRLGVGRGVAGSYLWFRRRGLHQAA